MRLGRLILHNIGSVVSAEVPLQDGVTIIAGDVGTGKTTLLRSLAAGLLGTDRGDAATLLRWGADSGSIGIELETERGTTRMTRSLVRDGSTVVQGDLTLSGLRSDVMSPTTAHARMFAKMFGFPVSYSARHEVFEHVFAVPQEGMRHILDESPKERMSVLRRIFGVERFAVAGENAQAVARELSSRVREAAPNVDALVTLKQALRAAKQRLVELEDERRSHRPIIKSLEHTVSQLSTKAKQAVSWRTELASLTERKRLLANSMDVPVRKARVGQLATQLRSALKQQARADRHDSKRAKLSEQLTKTDTELEGLDKRLKRAQRRVRQLRGLSGECSLCGTPLTASRTKKLVGEQQAKVRRIRGRITEMRQLVSTLIAKRTELGAPRAADALARSARLRVEHATAVEELSTARAHREEYELVKEKVAKLTAAVAKDASATEHLDDARTRLSAAQRRYDVAEALAKEQESKIADLQSRYAQVKQQLAVRESVASKARWVSGRFIPEMQALEREQLERARSMLENYFAHWLGMLLAGGFTVGVAEDCSPLVYKSGFAVPNLRHGLSGGQRTAVGLAYHLAIRSAYQAVYGDAAPSFLILDEPTSGFSSLQLDSLRDVIRALDAKQVLLVTHEVEQLAPVADSIIRLTLNGDGHTIVHCG